MPDERDDDDPSEDESDAGQSGRYDRERTVPSHVLFFESVAPSPVVGRPPAVGARLAGALVLYELYRVARRTDPAARVALLYAFDLTDVARSTALRLGHIVRS